MAQGVAAIVSPSLAFHVEINQVGQPDLAIQGYGNVRVDIRCDVLYGETSPREA